MTQIQPEHPNRSSSPHPHRTSNQPADLHSIYQSIAQLNQSIPTRSQPISIPSPLNLVGLTCHAFLVSNSFRFKPPPTQQSQSQSQSHQDAAGLLVDWDSLLAPNQSSLHFCYSHPQSSLSFEFTFSKIGNRITIAGITVQDDRLATWNLLVPEYLEPNSFPLDLTRDQQTDAMGFRSSTHLLNFISLFVNEILNPLMPDLFPTTSTNQRSPPSTNSSTSHTTATGNSQAPRPIPVPLDPSPPPTQVNNPVRSPLEIGRSDLEPIGTSNLWIPSLYNHLPGAELDQRSGMTVHPHHPIFRPPPHFGQPEPFHPPRARFDPIGPNPSASAYPDPRASFGFDTDPMGGLGQGLPLQIPRTGFAPHRPNFNEFHPPGPASGYDDTFM